MKSITASSEKQHFYFTVTTGWGPVECLQVYIFTSEEADMLSSATPRNRR
jgi:hypothetical protein